MSKIEMRRVKEILYEYTEWQECSNVERKSLWDFGLYIIMTEIIIYLFKYAITYVNVHTFFITKLL